MVETGTPCGVRCPSALKVVVQVRVTPNPNRVGRRLGTGEHYRQSSRTSPVGQQVQRRRDHLHRRVHRRATRERAQDRVQLPSHRSGGARPSEVRKVLRAAGVEERHRVVKGEYDYKFLHSLPSSLRLLALHRALPVPGLGSSQPCRVNLSIPSVSPTLASCASTRSVNADNKTPAWTTRHLYYMCANDISPWQTVCHNPRTTAHARDRVPYLSTRAATI